MNSIIRPESAVNAMGVEARAFNVVAEADGRIRNAKIGATRHYKEDGRSYRIGVELRFDDELNNGHETFAITASIDEAINGRYREFMGGCCHDEIARHFPEFAPLIKWHLCSTDGPMHYPGNPLFLAGERDCWGLLKGEPSSFEYGVRFGGSPSTIRIHESFWKFLKERLGSGPFVRSEYAHERDPKTYGVHYSVHGYAERWHECPFRDLTEADEFIAALNSCPVEFVKVPSGFSEGKARELDNARSSAIWPEATDEELMAADLKEKLEARLPRLLKEFKAAMLSVGFLWPERKTTTEVTS